MAKTKIGMIGSTLAILAAAVFTGNASAMTVTVDGIKSAGEYTGTHSGSKSLLWFNEHRSIYTEAAGNMNPLVYEINQIAAGNFSLNLFFEVPTYARRMIWADDCDYEAGGGVSGDCSPLAPGGDTSFLDAYDEGSHHSDVDMDYKTQTGSEYFELRGLGLKIDWQDEDNDGLNDDFTWATSREYLLDQGICTEDLCTEFERTSSIEVMWQGLSSKTEAEGIINSVTKMELHLSDEARGLPPVNPPGAVPVPAAFWLFGTALIGFIGMSRRTKV